MLYYIPTVGYVSGAFILDEVQYPSKWLELATEEERAAIGAVAEPTVSATQLVTKGAEGWEVRDKTAEELAADQAAAEAMAASVLKKDMDRCWARYDAIVSASVDLNARSQYLYWLMDTEASVSTLKRQRINEVISWTQQVWQTYYMDKADIVSGVLTEYRSLPGCPWTFTEIAFTP